MNVEIETVATQFLFGEYLFQIFGNVFAMWMKLCMRSLYIGLPPQLLLYLSLGSIMDMKNALWDYLARDICLNTVYNYPLKAYSISSDTFVGIFWSLTFCWRASKYRVFTIIYEHIYFKFTLWRIQFCGFDLNPYPNWIRILFTIG